jgi:multiple antibiotic resistance protein
VKFFWEVFVTLLVITDPPGIVPVFLGLTRGLSARDRNRLPGRRRWWRSA